MLQKKSVSSIKEINRRLLFVLHLVKVFTVEMVQAVSDWCKIVGKY